MRPIMGISPAGTFTGPRACFAEDVRRLSGRSGLVEFNYFLSEQPHRGFYAQTSHSRFEASRRPPPLWRSGRFPGAAWPGAGATGRARGPALEGQLYAGRYCHVGEQFWRRWRGKPGGVYYPAFDPAACAFCPGQGAGPSSQVGSDAGSPAGAGRVGFARAGGYLCGSRRIRPDA